MISRFALLWICLLASSGVLAIHSSQPEARPHSPSSDIEPELSLDWAGAIWNLRRGDFLTITATIIAPTPSDNKGGASAWVGIDGYDLCPDAALRAGISFIYINGVPEWHAWYEWYPSGLLDVPNFQLSAGHSITVTVTSNTTTSGTVYFKNQATGQVFEEVIGDFEHPLCQQSAEWIVEDYKETLLVQPIANFGTVSFIDATASGPYMLFTPLDAKVILIALQEDTKLNPITSTETGDTTLTVKYTG